MILQWTESSIPSPSSRDSVILKENKIRVREIDVRNDGQKIKYVKVQKRFFTKNYDVIYEDWKISNHPLITEELLNKEKSIPVLQTFINSKYVNSLICSFDCVVGNS